jgi:hypothetical protein
MFCICILEVFGSNLGHVTGYLYSSFCGFPLPLPEEEKELFNLEISLD